MVNIVLTPCPLAGEIRTSPGDGGDLDHTQLGQDSDIGGLQSLDDDAGLRVSEAGVRGRHQELVARPGLEAGPGRAGRGQHQRELSAVAAIVEHTCY